MNTSKKPLHNAFFVLPALFLMLCGCPLTQSLTNETFCSFLVFGAGAALLAVALVTGRVKAFG